MVMFSGNIGRIRNGIILNCKWNKYFKVVLKKGENKIANRKNKVIKRHIGETRFNNLGTQMKIVDYRNNDDLDIEFQDSHKYVKEHQTYSNFKAGTVKNPYDITVCGVGYIGHGKYVVSKNKIHTEAYESWRGMMLRCYHKAKCFKTYTDIVTVNPIWHDFQNYADWYYKNKYLVNERLHLDKDILNPLCKEYAPQNCLLVPQRINLLFSNKPNNRGLPNGIYHNGKGYSAKYAGENIGSYNSLDEAYFHYTKAKEDAIKRIANEYIDIIPDKVYQALMNYEQKIEYDKNYKSA